LIFYDSIQPLIRISIILILHTVISDLAQLRSAVTSACEITRKAFFLSRFAHSRNRFFAMRDQFECCNTPINPHRSGDLLPFYCVKSYSDLASRDQKRFPNDLAQRKTRFLSKARSLTMVYSIK